MKKDKAGRSRGGRILLYGLCVALSVFYIVVLWWGKNPKVGIEYKMYYITHELTDWPGYGKLTYTPGTDEYCTGLKDRLGRKVPYRVCRRKGQGWEKEQYDGSVNKGTQSWLYYLPDTSVKEPVLTVEVNYFKGMGKVAVYAEDILIGSIEAAGLYEFRAPQITADTLLTIRFEAQDCEFGVWRVRLG